MALINLESAHLVQPQKAEVEVREVVTVRPRANQDRAYLAKPDQEWDWRELRDYVVDQIERQHGLFPRNSKQEYGIFSRFANTFGADAPAIARFAFEVEGGFWLGAPISVTRFCKGSDPFFAQPIIERLREVRR